ncbi:MAG: hypothetical protein ACOVSW_10645, partial [Candidatus Kapaibacteriota bacterium]
MLHGCPHHIEQMVEKMAPPKGYKPSYTTSSTSLKKLLEQTNTPKSTTSASTTAPATIPFDPSQLASFPYSSQIPPALASSTAATSLGGMDSSAFAGSMPKNLPNGLPDITQAMKGLLGDSALTKTLASGNMDSALATFKNMGGGGVGGQGISTPDMESLFKDSSFAKTLAAIPNGIPPEMLENLSEQLPQIMNDSSFGVLSKTFPQAPSPKQAPQKSPKAKSPSGKSSSDKSLPEASSEQGFAGMAQKLAQMLPQISAMKQAYQRAQREAEERELQAEYERIAQAEEREAIASEEELAQFR